MGVGLIGPGLVGANPLLSPWAGASGAVFLPSDVAGLQLWLKADGTLWQDSARTTPATADGDPVGAVDDVIGTNHAVQATSAKRGTLKLAIQNGRNVVRFDGVDDYLETPSISFGNDAATLFIVAKVTTKTFYGMFLVYGSGGGGSWNLRQNGSSGRLELVNGATNQGPGVGGGSTTADLEGQGFKILEGSFDAADNWEIWENGVSKDDEPGAFTQAASNPIGVGARSDGFTINGDVGEVIVYDTELSTTDRQAIEVYLADRWGITL